MEDNTTISEALHYGIDALESNLSESETVNLYLESLGGALG